jgi:simple sugar transport system ATP-binding protein
MEPGPRLALELSGIVVRFGRVVACDHAGLSLAHGEIHSLVGENGAGKSTLMHVAAGLLRPESGILRLNGRERAFASAAEAQQSGVAMVFQNFLLVEPQTVLDNILLGWSKARGVLNRNTLAREVRSIAGRVGLAVDLDAEVRTLSAGDKQKVALLRALSRDVKVLVLDEPTAVLTPSEAETLMDTMRRLAASGVSILFVSHKLPEILAVSDRITVMHKGRTVAESVGGRGASAKQVAAMMVGLADAAGQSQTSSGPAAPVRSEGSAAAAGRHVRSAADAGATASLRETDGATAHSGRTGGAADAGRNTLVLDHVTLEHGGTAPGVRAAQGRVMLLDDVSLTVSGGQITGIAGVSGNGQRELAAVCAGMLAATRGSVRVCGRDLTGLGPRAFGDAGLRYLCEDRYHEGSSRCLTLTETAALKDYPSLVSGRLGFLDRGKLAAHAEKLMRDYDVVAPSPTALTAALSGGNLQKLLLGRELASGPRVLVVHQPTQGLDLAATRFLRDELKRMAAAGAAVLLLSSDLDEVLELSDVVEVMYRGRLLHGGSGKGIDRAAIGALMAGVEA